MKVEKQDEMKVEIQDEMKDENETVFNSHEVFLRSLSSLHQCADQ